MCGIFGFIAKKGSYYPKQLLKQTVERIAVLSESRGKDSSGIAFRNERSRTINVIKGAIPVSELINEKLVQIEIENYLNINGFNREESLENTFAVIGHSRLVTNGSQLDDVNNQPVIKDGIVGIHNGIIVNVNDLWEKHQQIDRKYEIDTEVLLSLIRSKDNNGHSSEWNISKAVGEIFGTVATALFFNYKDEFVLTTNNGSLYILSNFKDILIFASERFILSELIKERKLKKAIGTFELKQVKPRTGYILIYSDFSFRKFDYSDVSKTNGLPKKYDKNYAINIKNVGDDQEHRAIIVNAEKFRFSTKASSENKLLEYNDKKINNLLRCTKCVLPETFPFIKFDEKGICNYCHNYKPKNKPKSLDELHKLVEPFKKNNGEPDCIVPFSGGRDSTFTLHIVKEKLGMIPLAFTYDWGMVTDLARRNIARVCGKLGVENIIVAADIRKKRNNIRKNISAWLKNPSLGMIPLFMAGDKYFFYYTNQLKKQTDITLNIWGINYLENTDFKTGFAGIPPKFNKKRIYSLSFVNQLKLFGFVGKNLIANPGYLNNSVPDTFGSFLARYIAPKKDYFHFYDHYRWDEKEIENVILNEYEWETASDTKSTWRIGDGTASFYNYVYFNIAGFSEIDTFRSNQIREGMLTREEGLNLIGEENRPRYESIKWYLEIIGLDFENTIKAINNIPKLYQL